MAAFVFPASGTISGAVDFTQFLDTGRSRLAGLTFPSNWTAGTLTFLICTDGSGTNYQPLYGPIGVIYSITTEASAYVPVDLGVFGSITNVKLQNSVAQAQSATVSVTLGSPNAPGLGTGNGSGSGGGGGGGTNASVGVNGVAAPTSSTENGFVNSAGNLTGVSTATPLPISSGNGSLTDGSGSITTANGSQLLFAANPARKYLFVQNNSAGSLWINYGSAATLSSPSVVLTAGQSYENPSSFVSSQAINIVGATAGQSFTAKQG